MHNTFCSAQFQRIVFRKSNYSNVFVDAQGSTATKTTNLFIYIMKKKLTKIKFTPEQAHTPNSFYACVVTESLTLLFIEFTFLPESYPPLPLKTCLFLNFSFTSQVKFKSDSIKRKTPSRT
jgi:hypothetical protein